MRAGSRSVEPPGAALPRASRWRRALAGTVDIALFGTPLILSSVRALRAGEPHGQRRAALIGRIGNVVVALATVLRARGASPGTRLAGIVTVDRASGRRAGVLRAAILSLLDQAPALAFAPLASRRRARQSAARSAARRGLASHGQQVRDLVERHRDDPDALRVALAELNARSRGPSLLPQVLAEFCGKWLLRRSLAPLRARVAGECEVVRRRSGVA